jgi:hypothetical protein
MGLHIEKMTAEGLSARLESTVWIPCVTCHELFPAGLGDEECAVCDPDGKTWWVEEYTCGCSADTTAPSTLLGYCSKHGANKKRRVKFLEANKSV